MLDQKTPDKAIKAVMILHGIDFRRTILKFIGDFAD